MNFTHSSSYSDSDKNMDVPKSNECESTHYTNITHPIKAFDLLQSLRRDEFLCDIRLKADDDTIILGHKIVLMSASEYFRAMFTNFSEHNKDIVDIKEIDSTVLKQLVDYIYSGKIVISKNNVKVLLPAASILQLDYVKDVCAEFLQKQLNPTNCLSIRSFADLHNCTELISNSEAYIRKNFVDVVKGDEFLCLSTEELIALISSYLNASEEKVYQSVINWAKYELNVRHNSLPKLMEHIRLPLLSLDYISSHVVGEPLFKNIPKSDEYLIEVYDFHADKTQKKNIPQTIRNTPRMSGQKVFLIFGRSCKTLMYDPTTNLSRQLLPENKMIDFNCVHKLTLVKEHFVIFYNSSFKVFDLTSKSQYLAISLIDTLVYRSHCGLCEFNDCLYSVGGCGLIQLFGQDIPLKFLNSVEVLDIRIEKRRMVSSMSTKRACLAVGVLNNLLYAVGGRSEPLSNIPLRTVECYDPSLDKWTPVAEMSGARHNHGVAAINGVLYAVGGQNEYGCLKSVEAYKPSTGVWTSIPDMHHARCGSSVLALDGLLYVVGGYDGGYNGEPTDDYGRIFDRRMDSIEIYNPSTNTWSIEKMSKSLSGLCGGIMVDKSLVAKFHG